MLKHQVHVVKMLAVVFVTVVAIVLSQETAMAKDDNPMSTMKVKAKYKGNDLLFTIKYRAIDTEGGLAVKVESASFKVLKNKKKKKSKLRYITVSTWAIGRRFTANGKELKQGKSKTKNHKFKKPKTNKTYTFPVNQKYYYCPDPGRSTINYDVGSYKIGSKKKTQKDFTYGWGWIGGGTPNR